MKPVRRVLPALLLSLFAGATASTASAAQFSGVVVFGDSLSDAGYYRPFLAGLGLPASVVSTLGRFTTNPGPVWSELVSQYYGFTGTPSNVTGGNIFAQGGATVATNSPSTPPGFAQRPVSTQIGEYLARNGGRADPGALHAVWAGGNDFLNGFSQLSAGQITQAQFQTNFLAAAGAEVQQVGRLYGAGARYVMVFTLPDIGITPFALSTGPVNAATATAAAAGYNTTLFTGLASAGLRPIPVDVFSLLAEIRGNAAAFGFTNLTGIACGPFPPITTSGNSQFCGPSNLVAAGADQTYLFADGVHPSSGAHRIIGNFVTSLIEGPTSYSLLAESPLRTRALHVATLQEGLAQGERAAPGKLAAFAGSTSSDFDVDPVGGSAGVRTSNRALSVGVTMRASEAVTVGAALGKTKADASFTGEGGGYRTDELSYSVFAAMKSGGFYANGVASMSTVDFDEMRRTITLGQVKRTATANTSGSNGSVALAGGYDFAIGKFAIGPTAAWTSQNVEVNGFDEAGGGAAGLRMASQKRRSEVGSLGVRASWDLGPIIPYVRYTADKERKNDERLVTATPLTMAATGSSYDLPAYASDSSYTTLTVGARGVFGGWLGYGVHYMKVSGRSGVKEDGIGATVSILF
jgi:outer membrane lipase/esterase